MAQSTLSSPEVSGLDGLKVTLFRLGLGPLLSARLAGSTLVLLTADDSGKVQRTPAAYTRSDGVVYCWVHRRPGLDWPQILANAPEVSLWIGNSWWQGQAEIVVDPAHLREMPMIPEAATLLRIHLGEPITGHDGPGSLVWLWSLLPLLIPLAAWLLYRAIRPTS